MAKAPVTGRCKTRLAPRLGMRGAAQLQGALIQMVMQSALKTGLPVWAFASPNIQHPVFQQLRRRGIRLQKQRGKNLGQRMLFALRQVLKTHPAAIVLGTDCPSLSPEIIRSCTGELSAVHVIAADDGGYVAIAMNRAEARLFAAVNWSTPRVLQQTRRNARRLQQPFELWPSLPDLDHPRDWMYHRRHKLLSALANCKRY